MKTKSVRAQPSQVTRQLTLLPKLSLAELKQEWRSLYETEPPARIGRGLLMRAIAYRLQERVFGGLKPSTKRLLERLAANVACGRPLNPTATARASAGTVLMREWQGVTHQVTVLDRDVVYRKQRYRSLSEVARLITGCRWSGPRFFGLRSKAGREGEDGKP